MNNLKFTLASFANRCLTFALGIGASRGDFQLRQCGIAQQLALPCALNVDVAALSLFVI